LNWSARLERIPVFELQHASNISFQQLVAIAEDRTSLKQADFKTIRILPAKRWHHFESVERLIVRC
jgi:hypothetical protein